MSALNMIGKTPLINVDGIYIKCEFLNPTGSSKDRIAYEMLIHERREIILEATSGNTGISVAFVCAALNKKCMIFAPKSTSLHKIRAMRAYGATVANDNDTMQDAIRSAWTIMDSSTTMRYLNQFANKYNLIAQTKMAQEIKQLGITPDCIICGIGTSGTLAGLHKVFPNADFFTPMPQGFEIEGISDGVALPLKPKQCRLTEFPVNYMQVRLTAKYLANKKGLWVGLSTAANFYVADQIKKNYKTIVIIGHDNGWRYGT